MNQYYNRYTEKSPDTVDSVVSSNYPGPVYISRPPEVLVHPVEKSTSDFSFVFNIIFGILCLGAICIILTPMNVTEYSYTSYKHAIVQKNKHLDEAKKALSLLNLYVLVKFVLMSIICWMIYYIPSQDSFLYHVSPVYGLPYKQLISRVVLVSYVVTGCLIGYYRGKASANLNKLPHYKS
jgi:hypothetical protein